MSTTQKNKWADLFTILILVLTVFQGLIPSMPIANTVLLATISAITMYVANGLTIWKNYLSNEIDNSANRPALILAIIATLGGLNDLFDVITFSDVTGQWIRFAITLLSAILTLVSKLFYPTENTRSNF